MSTSAGGPGRPTAYRRRHISNQSRPITRWNILALVIMGVGVALSWYAGQFSLQRWAESGVKFGVRQWSEVDLPEGDLIVYYESRVAVPGNASMLNVRGPDGRMLPPRFVQRGVSQASGQVGGLSIEDLFVVDIREPGTHELFLFNSSYNPDEIPPDDRIAVLKQPRTLVAALERRQRTMLAGGGITGALAIICYILHFRLLLVQRVERLRSMLPTSTTTTPAANAPIAKSPPDQSRVTP